MSHLVKGTLGGSVGPLSGLHLGCNLVDAHGSSCCSFRMHTLDRRFLLAAPVLWNGSLLLGEHLQDGVLTVLVGLQGPADSGGDLVGRPHLLSVSP